MKDDTFAQGYNPKDLSHRKEMSRMVSEYRKAVRTRLGIYDKKSEIQNVGRRHVISAIDVKGIYWCVFPC